MFFLRQRRPVADEPSVEARPGRDDSVPLYGARLWSVRRGTGRKTSTGSFRFQRAIHRLRSEQSGGVVPPPAASRPTRPGPKFAVIFRVPPRTQENGVAGVPIVARQHTREEPADPGSLPVARCFGTLVLAALAGAVPR